MPADVYGRALYKALNGMTDGPETLHPIVSAFLALDQAFLLNLQLAEPNSIIGWMMVFNILNIKMELSRRC